MVRSGTACLALIYKAPTSASAVEDMTALIIFAMIAMEPLSEEAFVSVSEGVESAGSASSFGGDEISCVLNNVLNGRLYRSTVFL